MSVSIVYREKEKESILKINRAGENFMDGLIGIETVETFDGG